MGVSFVTVYKMAEPVAQQMRNCVCKTQTATTGTRPPLVASQYMICCEFETLAIIAFVYVETALEGKANNLASRFNIPIGHLVPK